MTARQRHNFMLVGVARSLLGGLVGLILARLVYGLGYLPSLLLPSLIGFTAGALIGRRTVAEPRLDRFSAARIVDARLRLEDRLATAVEATETPSQDQLLPWLVYDASLQAPFIDPVQVLPRRWSREWRWVAALALSAAILFSPLFPPVSKWPAAASLTDPALARQGAELKRLADALQAEARERRSAQLRQLASELRRLARDMEANRVNRNQAMAHLAALEQRLAQLRPELLAHAAPSDADGVDPMALRAANELMQNMAAAGSTDPQARQRLTQALQALSRSGSGLSQADALREIVRQIEQGDLRQAADRLQSLVDAAEPAPRGGEGSGGDGRDGATGSPTGAPQEADDPLASAEQQLTQARTSLAQDVDQPGSGPDRMGPEDPMGENDPGSGGSGGSGGGSGDDLSPPGGSPSGSGSNPGSGKGSGAQGGDFPQRSAGLQPTRIQGQFGDGTLAVGALGGTATSGQPSSPRASSTPGAFRPGQEEAVQRENIPTTYRQWIKEYFERLEQG